MSELMTSGEIEDVLTSIRRLVSEDLRPTPMAVVTPAVEPGTPPAAQIVSRMVVSDKLILTPALRVVSSRLDSAAQSRVGPQVRPSATRPTSLEPATSAPEAAQPAVAEPVRAAPNLPLPRLHLEAAQSVPAAGQAALRPKAPLVAPDLVATLAQAVDQQAALDWESEAGEPAADTEALNWENFVFVRRSMQDMWSARDGAAAKPEPADKPETAAQPEPVPEPASVAEDWADAAEAEVLADLRDQDKAEARAEDSAAEVIPGYDQQEDDIFSEQVLRELVRDLIREELQGGLGERITRNIRKLVRAEIARSLAVHDLD
jgi:hypothetical protein